MASASADLEAGETLGLLVTGVDRVHPRTPGTLLHEPRHPVDGLGRTFQHDLDGAVRAVPGPAGDACRPGPLAGRVAEEDALHAAVRDEPPPDHRVRHLPIMY